MFAAGVQQMIGEIRAGLIERGWKPGHDLTLDERPAGELASGISYTARNGRQSQDRQMDRDHRSAISPDTRRRSAPVRADS